jgi:hypothetical protein
MSQFFSGLRFRLVLLVVLASLPPVVLTLHIARQDRQRQTAALRQRSQDLVKLAARKEDEMIAGTRQLLRAVAESSQVRSARWGNCTKLLRTLFADYPRYANLGVIKTNGDGGGQRPPDDGTGQPNRPFVLPTRARHARLRPLAIYRSAALAASPVSISVIRFSIPTDRSRPWSSPRWIWTGSTVSIMRCRRNCPKEPPGPRLTRRQEFSRVIPRRKNAGRRSLSRKNHF